MIPNRLFMGADLEMAEQLFEIMREKKKNLGIKKVLYNFEANFFVLLVILTSLHII
jgi:hypothetical protein